MTRPRIRTEGTLLPGLAALALFALMASVFLTASIGVPTGDATFQTQPKVVNVSIDQGESASLNATNETTYVDITDQSSGTLVAQVPVSDNGSADATLTMVNGTAMVQIDKSVGITRSLGVALFDLGADRSGTHPRIESVRMAAIPSEGFLLAFEIIDVVLVAALVAAVMLARREEDGVIVSAIAGAASGRDESVATDGGDGT